MSHSISHQLPDEMPNRRATADGLALEDVPSRPIDGQAGRPIVRPRLAGVQPSFGAPALSIEPPLLRGDRAMEAPSQRCGLNLCVA